MKTSSILLAVAMLGAATSAIAQTAPTVSVTDVTPAGRDTSSGMQNAASNNWFANNGETLFVVKGGAVPVTATVKTQATTMSQQGYGSAPLSDQTVSIPAASVVMMGPFPTGRWNNQYGLTGVSITSITGVSITAINVPQ